MGTLIDVLLIAMAALYLGASVALHVYGVNCYLMIALYLKGNRRRQREERAIRVTNSLRFLNHRRQPNAEIEGLDLYAVRNIQPGREIHIHYGPDWEE